MGWAVPSPSSLCLRTPGTGPGCKGRPGPPGTPRATGRPADAARSGACGPAAATCREVQQAQPPAPSSRQPPAAASPAPAGRLAHAGQGEECKRTRGVVARAGGHSDALGDGACTPFCNGDATYNATAGNAAACGCRQRMRQAEMVVAAVRRASPPPPKLAHCCRDNTITQV